MRLEQFLGLLGTGSRSGSDWIRRCPAHDDRTASLSVSEGRNGGIVVYCHAGCQPEAIVGQLGLTMKDLMPAADSSRGAAPVIAATYDYRDSESVLLYQVVRYVPKDFRQRRPDGSGGWAWNVRGVPQVPYRLPELLAASPDRPLFVVEGEKDADRLASLGLAATTNAGGAGKWSKLSDREAFRGRRVVVIPDNDDPGRRHAEEVRSSLDGIAAEITILELPGLPAKGDVSDWLNSGRTGSDLEGLAAEAKEAGESRAKAGLPATADLLNEVSTFVRRFIVLTATQADAIALWTLHTHAIDAAEQTPYLWISSPEKRCGKTKVLEVLELLVAKPWMTGRVSAAALVRKVDKLRPTLLLDESDAAFNGEKDYAEALRGLLNTGHKTNGRCSLCVGQGASIDYRDFSTFCPKAIAGIGRLPDTVADRAIPIRLQRKARTEVVERFRERKARPESEPLRTRIESWAVGSVRTLREAEPTLPEELSDRAQDGAEPLLAIADQAGGEWPERGRRALLELFAGSNPEEDSLGARLLLDCWTVFEERGVDRLASADLCQALLELEESPWRELHKGKPLTVRDLARLLNPFGVSSGSVRVGDGKTPKGYYRASFESSWSRYLPSPGFSNATTPQPAPALGFVDFSNRHTAGLVADEKRIIVNTDGPCGVVADGTRRKERVAAGGGARMSDTEELDI